MFRAFTYNLRFPGQLYDANTGLSYNYYRDYNGRTGRYWESDPIGLAGGINTYTYVGGNPISRVDPTGLSWSCVTVGIFLQCTYTNTTSIEWPEGYSPDPKTKGIPTVKTPANFPTKNPVDCVDCDEQLKKDYEQCRNTCESVLSGAACRLKAEFKYFLCKKQTPGSGLSGMGGGLGGDAGF